MAIIAGAEPKSFFHILSKERTTEPIENKHKLLIKVNNQSVISSSILSYIPATFKNMVGGKSYGGNNVALHKKWLRGVEKLRQQQKYENQSKTETVTLGPPAPIPAKGKPSSHVTTRFVFLTDSTIVA